jgi:hypothetical protein
MSNYININIYYLAKLHIMTKCAPPILVIPTKDNEINKSICESVNIQDNSNKIENKSSMCITSPQTFIYQSPQTFINQSPQTFINQSPQTFINQSPQTFRNQSPQTFINQSPQTFRNQSPQTFMYQIPQTFMNQCPQTFIYQSPQNYMYQTPRIYSDSPLIFSTSPLIFSRSPIMNSRSSSPNNYYINKLPVSYSPLIGNWKSNKESKNENEIKNINDNINNIIAKMYNNNSNKIVNNFIKLNLKFKFPNECSEDINQFKIFIRCPSSIFWVHLSYSIVVFIMYGMKGERSIHSLTSEEIDSINNNTDICGLLGVYLRKNKSSCGCNGDIMFNNENIAKQFIKFGKKQLSIDFKIPLNDPFFKIEWHKESIISYSEDNHSEDNHSEDNHSEDNHSEDNHSEDNKKLSIKKKKINLILPIGQNSSFKKFIAKNINTQSKIDNVINNNNLSKEIQNSNILFENNNDNDKEKIYEFYIKKILTSIKKKIGNKIHDLEDEVNTNSYGKNLNLKFNLEINDKEEHNINGNKIISYLSEFINNTNKQSLFFKKFQLEMRNLSDKLYFHLSCSIKENIFILDITKKYN